MLTIYEKNIAVKMDKEIEEAYRSGDRKVASFMLTKSEYYELNILKPKAFKKSYWSASRVHPYNPWLAGYYKNVPVYVEK